MGPRAGIGYVQVITPGLCLEAAAAARAEFRAVAPASSVPYEQGYAGGGASQFEFGLARIDDTEDGPRRRQEFLRKMEALGEELYEIPATPEERRALLDEILERVPPLIREIPGEDAGALSDDDVSRLLRRWGPLGDQNFFIDVGGEDHWTVDPLGDDDWEDLDEPGEEEVRVIDAWGRGEPTAVRPATEGVWHYQPRFSPDGASLAYCTNKTGNSDIFKEVRVEYNFDPINGVYREIAIVRDDRVDEEEEGSAWTVHQARGPVDLTPALKEAALLTLPQKMVCREDCRGICTGTVFTLSNGPG